jgi:S1-C subfamily serine protease
MRYISITLFLFCLIAGCATYSQMFINSNGEIRRCSATGQGLVGMATASNAVSGCVEDMKALGFIEIEQAGIIGVQFSQSQDTSLKIIRVIKSSPADFAGIKAGDRVVNVAGQDVTSSKDARALLFGSVGTYVEVVIERNSQRIPLKLLRGSYKSLVSTEERKNTDEPDTTGDRFGK